MAIQITSIKTTLKASSFFRQNETKNLEFNLEINIGLKSPKIEENLKEIKDSSVLEIFIKGVDNEVEYKGEYLVEYEAETTDGLYLKQQELDENIVREALKTIFKQIEVVFSSAGFNDFIMATGELQRA